MADSDVRVQLYVYDLSNGLARQLSLALLGKQLEGIWHTAIVIHWPGQTPVEYYYGGGIQRAIAGQTPFGHPVQVLDLGRTELPQDLVEEFLQDQASVFSPEAYSLFHHNCNNFTNEFSQFLVGSGIPSHITSLPQEVLATPFGQMMQPMLSNMENQMRSVRSMPYVPTSASTPAQPSAAAPGAAAANGGPSPAQAQGEQTGMEALAEANAAVLEEPLMVPPEPEANGNAAPNGDAAAATSATMPSKQQAQLVAGKAVNGEVNGTQLGAGKAAAAAANGASNGHDASGTRAAFQAQVQQEFARLMSGGDLTAQDAAAQALRKVAELPFHSRTLPKGRPGSAIARTSPVVQTQRESAFSKL
ncbi:hypothetical protein WJX72_003889 [[Myrmecia] bisecta]|uniref:PPPDE domain-containing protein n=1 Tax=[Myrmecia] bisecta TaxID=41462 RepID=A0AAW1R612_9CHLO